MRKRRPSPQSEYGKQLAEKQDLKGQYNLREKQFKGYVKAALEKSAHGDSPELFLQKLERRLDNVVYRAGFAPTRKQSRQMVTHGHFKVNGKKVDIPSYEVKKGDVITVRTASLQRTLFKNTLLGMKKYEAPAWMTLDKEKPEVTILQFPSFEQVAPSVEVSLIFEFYSR